MFDIDKLMKKLQDSGANVTINVINVGADTDIDTADDYDDDNFDTDFSLGDRVIVCHLKKDGSGNKHTDGTVIDISSDDFGPYVRVEGDNGKHYRCGLKLNEVRKGSQIIRIL